jgi:hypothetical protein
MPRLLGHAPKFGNQLSSKPPATQLEKTAIRGAVNALLIGVTAPQHRLHMNNLKLLGIFQSL